jgi:ribosomal protein L28
LPKDVFLNIFSQLSLADIGSFVQTSNANFKLVANYIQIDPYAPAELTGNEKMREIEFPERQDPNRKITNFELAVRTNCFGLLKLCLNKDNPKRSKLEDSESELVDACRHKIVPLVKIFLSDERLKPDLVNLNFVFGQVVYGGSLEVLKLLLEDSRFDPVSKKYDLVTEVCRQKRVDMLELLLANPKYDPTANDHKAFKCLTKGDWDDNMLEMAVMLAKDGRMKDLTVSDNALFKILETLGFYNTREKESEMKAYYPKFGLVYHDEPVEFAWSMLTDSRFDPSVFKNKAIILASIYGRLEIVEKLLDDRRVDPSDNNNEAIKAACSEGYLEIVEQLYAHEKVKHSVNSIDLQKLAKKKGHKNIVDFFTKQKSKKRKYH